MKSSLRSLRNSSWQDRVLFAVKAVSGSLLLFYFLFMVYNAYRVSGWRDAYERQFKEARTLALSYDSVRLAGDKLSGKPVLWSVSVTPGRQWHYQADKDRPILFLNPPDLVATHFLQDY